MLASWLEHPYIRRILPAAVRLPLDVSPRARRPVRDAGLIGAAGYPQPVFDSYASAGATGEARFESQPVTCNRSDACGSRSPARRAGRACGCRSSVCRPVRRRESARRGSPPAAGSASLPPARTGHSRSWQWTRRRHPGLRSGNPPKSRSDRRWPGRWFSDPGCRLDGAALALLALVSTVRGWRSRTVSPESTHPSLSAGVS